MAEPPKPRAAIDPLPQRGFVPELSLVAATVAYGATFTIVQRALLDATTLGFMTLRFGIATLVLTPFALRSGWRPRPVLAESAGDTAGVFLKAGIAFGIVGWVGYVFQNAGLQRTTTSNSAFITGLFVVFTPLVEAAVRRRAPTRAVSGAVVLAVAGLFLLTGAHLTVHLGDALTLGCAVCFGAWIFIGSEFANRFDPIALTWVQMATFTVLSLPFALGFGFGHTSARVWFAALVTGVVCSALAFTIQLWGQKRIEAARAAVILLLEPVVAGIVGYFIGERIGARGYTGALTILASILVAETPRLRAVAIDRRSARP